MAERQLTTILTREAFLNSSKHLKREAIELDGVGSIFVRELTGRQMLRFNEQIDTMKANGQEASTLQAMRLAAFLVAQSACDESGSLLFTEADIEQLMDVPFEKLRLVAEKTLELSGIYTVAESLKKIMSDSFTDS